METVVGKNVLRPNPMLSKSMERLHRHMEFLLKH